MPISGLLLTLNENPSARSETLLALQSRSEIDVGQSVERWLPIAVDAANDEESRNLHDWISALPAVEFVDVVSVHFDDENGAIEKLVCISRPKMGGTGDPPVPSGDSPLGMGDTRKQTVNSGIEKIVSIPSGQWPDGTGESPVLPKYEKRESEVHS